MFCFHPYLGKWSNLTNIFQMGWNHQPVIHFLFKVQVFDREFLTIPSFYKKKHHFSTPTSHLYPSKNPQTFFGFPGTSVTNTPGVHDDPWHTWRCPTFCRFGAWPCTRVGMVGTWAARTRAGEIHDRLLLMRWWVTVNPWKFNRFSPLQKEGRNPKGKPDRLPFPSFSRGEIF